VKIRLVAVGKPRDAEAAALHDRYADRIRKLGVTYDERWQHYLERLAEAGHKRKADS